MSKHINASYAPPIELHHAVCSVIVSSMMKPYCFGQVKSHYFASLQIILDPVLIYRTGNDAGYNATTLFQSHQN